MGRSIFSGSATSAIRGPDAFPTVLLLHVMLAARGWDLAPRDVDVAAIVELHAARGRTTLTLADARSRPSALTYAALVRGLHAPRLRPPSPRWHRQGPAGAGC